MEPLGLQAKQRKKKNLSPNECDGTGGLSGQTAGCISQHKGKLYLDGSEDRIEKGTTECFLFILMRQHRGERQCPLPGCSGVETVEEGPCSYFFIPGVT